MLTQLTIENFKSFGVSTSLALAPLTLLAGANSSGKTSIIQSVLLIKQTLQYAPTARPIALNGPLIKLGDFRDISNVNRSQDFIRIGWKLEFEWKGQASPTPFLYYYGARGDKPKTTSISFESDSVFYVPRKSHAQQSLSGLANLNPKLRATSFRVGIDRTDVNEQRSANEYFLEVKADVTQSREELSEASLNRRLIEQPDRYEFVDSDPLIQTEAIDQRSDGHIVGAILNHFLPEALLISYNEGHDQARRAAQQIAEHNIGPRRIREDMTLIEIPHAVISLLRESIARQSTSEHETGEEIFSEYGYDSVPLGLLLQELTALSRSKMGRNPPPHRTVLTGSRPYDFRDLQAQIQAILMESIGSKIVTVPVQVPQLSEYSMSVSYWFQHLVKYLGPLRDEPKPVYPLEALSNIREVGYRGEHTAAVLHLFGNEKIDYVPSTFVGKPTLVPTLKSATLYEAMIDWLQYLGVADDVKAGDEGKFGHTLQIRAPGVAKLHDLTNVGVGVSQVIPIVIQALLSEGQSLLIFEQPELHLHPRVQARLGDFFLAMSLQGKQCIVETHSEYLIDRVRRRIAESSEADLKNKVEIYFLERGTQGTDCRRVEISEYGAIVDWPKDFFDQTESETEAIIRAASNKRLAKRPPQNTDR